MTRSMRLLPLISFDRLDRYALRQMAAPLALSLAALLAAMLLERLLRLFDLAASAGVAFSSAVTVASNLVPHYLGLALPLAFTAAIFAAVARMSDDNELDVMLAVGRSMARISAPYFMLGVLIAVFNVYLFGQLQPLTRYYYHVAIDQMLQTSWDARLEENRFIDTGRGFSFSADAVETGTRHVRGVFIERRYPVAEEITTAANGQLDMSPGGRGPLLRLEDGQIVRERRDGTVSVIRFAQGEVFDIVPAMAPFRPRGDAIRERTLPELWGDMHRPAVALAGAPTPVAAGAAAPDALVASAPAAASEAAPAEGLAADIAAATATASVAADTAPLPSPTEAAAEFHGRLARTLLPPLLPLLAMPLGMASKRGRRAPGVIFAGLALLTLNHVLQFAQSLAASGRLPAAPALWLPFGLFGLLSLWIFLGSFAWPGDNPVSRAVNSVERLIERLRPRRRAALPKSPAT